MTTSPPTPRARSDRLASLAVLAALTSCIFALLSVAIYWLGLTEALVPLGLAYFLTNVGLGCAIATVENPFDPLAWFLLGSGVSFGLGVIDPMLLPALPGDYVTSHADAAVKIPPAMVLSYAAAAFVVGMVAIVGMLFGQFENPDAERLTLTRVLDRLFPYWWYGVAAALVACGLQLVLMAVPEFTGSRYLGQLCLLMTAIFCLFVGYNLDRASRVQIVGGIAIVLITFSLGFLALYKSFPLLPVLAVVGGYVLRRGSIFRSLVAVAILSVSFFALIQPVITTARFSPDYALSGMNLERRIAAVFHGLTAVGHIDSGGEQLLRRVSLFQYEAFVINQFDKGSPGNSMSEWYWGFAPRVLFPQKPSVSRYGQEFFMLYTGSPSPSSSSAMGYMAEGYWNGGYSLALFVACVFGLEIGLIRHLMRRAAERKSLLALIFAPAAAYFGHAVETMFTLHKVSLFMIVLAAFLFANLVASLRPMVGTRLSAVVGHQGPPRRTISDAKLPEPIAATSGRGD